MRELTKSMLRMSWALPLFGVKQMTHLIVPSGANQEKTALALDAVSAAAQQELGGALDELYATGDRLQRGAVDAAFGVMFLDMLNPARWMPGNGGCSGCGDDDAIPAPSIPAAPPISAAPPPAHPSAPPPVQPAAPSTSAPSSPESQPSPTPGASSDLGWGPKP